MDSRNSNIINNNNNNNNKSECSSSCSSSSSYSQKELKINLNTLSLSSFSYLPLDVIQEILSFLPANIILRTVATVSSRLYDIIHSESYWRNLWTTRLIACFHHYVQSPYSNHSLNQISSFIEFNKSFLPDINRFYILPLISVPTAALPRVESIEKCYSSNGGIVTMKVEQNNYNNNNSERHFGLNVKPLLVISENINAEELARRLLSSTTTTFSTKKNTNNISLQLCKALYFLENFKSSKVLASTRRMIDGLHTLRLFILSHALPPPTYRREGTLEERELALVEFIEGIIYSWKCCYPVKSSQYNSNIRVHFAITEEEITPTSIFHQTEEEIIIPTTTTNNINNNNNDNINSITESLRSEVREGDYGDGVFFPVCDAIFPSSSNNNNNNNISTSVMITQSEGGIHTLRYSLHDIIIYLFLLHHVSFSDIHQHVWEDERKCAICSRVISPTGRAVEFRFFMSSLLGSYPRFFVKMVFANGKLPNTCIQETFEHESSRTVRPSSNSSSDNDNNNNSDNDNNNNSDNNNNNNSDNNNNNNSDNNNNKRRRNIFPKLATLFYGGFGRVEVDIPPTISHHDFIKLRRTLGLSHTFPMKLLWNVVIFATGAGGVILREQLSSFEAYYQTSFTKAFDKVFASTSD